MSIDVIMVMDPFTFENVWLVISTTYQTLSSQSKNLGVILVAKKNDVLEIYSLALRAMTFNIASLQWYEDELH